MIEALVAVTATTGLFALAKGIRGNQTFRATSGLTAGPWTEGGDDLPCPWCYAPTLETDTHCQGCGRSFG
jgi:hypothetical protein